MRAHSLPGGGDAPHLKALHQLLATSLDAI
jgi:hypothetical protein